jgi:hypothetical protein
MQSGGFFFGGGGGGIRPLHLPPGRYRATETVEPRFRALFGIRAADATASDTVIVTKSGSHAARRAAGPGPVSHPLAELPASVPTLRNPPASALPDLVPLPSWGIRTSAQGHGSGKPATDFLNFGATVWIGGHARLDVEGFRHNGATVMPAYQYFFRNGKVIGRVRAGTMGFDSEPGHRHWHFQQFAKYRLLSARSKLVQASGKVGFCIAPTDGVDTLLPWGGLAADLLRLQRPVRQPHRPVGQGGAPARLGRHLRAVRGGPGLRHHQGPERHLLRSGHRQPAARAARAELPQ